MSKEPVTDYALDGHYYSHEKKQKSKLSYHEKSQDEEEDIRNITSFATLSDLTEPSTPYVKQDYLENGKYRAKDIEKQQFSSQKSTETDVYIVKQKRGYCSIFFSVVQTLVLIAMTWQCKLAPMSINPMVGPYPDALSYWGGKNTVLILEDNEYWRLVTPIFLHAGLIHLFGNIAVQLESGVFFEREWGSVTWLIVYLVSALGSSILSCVSMPNSISVGSSGAVMGLFGAKLSEIFCRACERRCTKQDELAHKIRMEQLGMVLCSVVVVGLFSFVPYVDWAAHLGGLIAGQTVGLMIFSLRIRTSCWRIIWCLVGLAITILSFSVALYCMFNFVQAEPDLRDVCDYYKRSFEGYECNCQLE